MGLPVGACGWQGGAGGEGGGKGGVQRQEMLDSEGTLDGPAGGCLWLAGRGGGRGSWQLRDEVICGYFCFF